MATKKEKPIGSILQVEARIPIQESKGKFRESEAGLVLPEEASSGKG